MAVEVHQNKEISGGKNGEGKEVNSAIPQKANRWSVYIKE